MTIQPLRQLPDRHAAESLIDFIGIRIERRLLLSELGYDVAHGLRGAVGRVVVGGMRRPASKRAAYRTYIVPDVRDGN